MGRRSSSASCSKGGRSTRRLPPRDHCRRTASSTSGSRSPMPSAPSHRRGVVHANLKPSNVFITNDGHVKLLELGAAGAVATEEPPAPGDAGAKTTSVTPVPAIPPSLASEFFHPYLSPEQVAGSFADARSDIFATGALLYEMATGMPAFKGASLAEIASDISAREPARPRDVRSDVPPALEAIILRALDKTPDRRYQRASELVDDLRRARRTIDARASSGPWWRTRTGLRVGIAAAVVAIAVLAMMGFARWRWTPVVERSAILVSDIANGTGDPDFDGTLRQGDLGLSRAVAVSRPGIGRADSQHAAADGAQTGRAADARRRGGAVPASWAAGDARRQRRRGRPFDGRRARRHRLLHRRDDRERERRSGAQGRRPARARRADVRAFAARSENRARLWRGTTSRSKKRRRRRSRR